MQLLLESERALPAALSDAQLDELDELLDAALSTEFEEATRDYAQTALVVWVNRIDGPCDRTFDSMIDAVMALSFHVSWELQARRNGSGHLEGVTPCNWQAIAEQITQESDEACLLDDLCYGDDDEESPFLEEPTDNRPLLSVHPSRCTFH